MSLEPAAVFAFALAFRFSSSWLGLRRDACPFQKAGKKQGWMESEVFKEFDRADSSWRPGCSTVLGAK